MLSFLQDRYMVGSILKDERERQGKTLQEVARATHIREVFLRHMEEDAFDKLPSKVHVTGFLQLYGKFLGLHEQTILNAYKKQMYLIQEVPIEEIVSISHDFSSSKVSRRRYAKFFSWFMMIILGVLLVSLSVVGLKRYLSYRNAVIVTIDDTHASHIFEVKKGDRIQFVMKAHLESYQLVDITNSSITLKNLNSQEVLPPIFDQETLEYGKENSLTYEYSLSVKERNQSTIMIQVQQIQTIKNDYKNTYVIVKNASSNSADNEINSKDPGVITLQNNGTQKMTLVLVDTSNDTSTVELNPMEKKSINFISDHIVHYKKIYVQNLLNLLVNANHEVITQKNVSAAGAIGILTCTTDMDAGSITSCNMSTGKYQ